MTVDKREFVRRAEEILNEMIPRDPNDRHLVTYRDDISHIVNKMEEMGLLTFEKSFFENFKKALLEIFRDYQEDEDYPEVRIKDYFIVPAVLATLKEYQLE